MDERGRQLTAQLQFMERNGRALEELVAKMLHIREEEEAFLGVFAKTLQDVAAQEDNKTIAQSLQSLGSSSAKLASETHDTVMQRAEPEILQVLAQIQDWGIVPMKVRHRISSWSAHSSLTWVVGGVYTAVAR
jgi:hypothetical protein